MTFKEDILYRDKLIIAEALKELVKVAREYYNITEPLDFGEDLKVEKEFLQSLASADNLIVQLENQEDS